MYLLQRLLKIIFFEFSPFLHRITASCEAFLLTVFLALFRFDDHIIGILTFTNDAFVEYFVASSLPCDYFAKPEEGCV